MSDTAQSPVIYPSTGRRPYPTHTKLGRILAERGLRVAQVSTAARVYPRTMTELLAGRQRASVAVLARLAEALDVEPDELVGLVDADAGDDEDGSD